MPSTFFEKKLGSHVGEQTVLGASHREASIAIFPEKNFCLGYTSINLPHVRYAIDDYLCSFSGQNVYQRNEKTFLRYLAEKEKIELLEFGCDFVQYPDSMPDNQTLACVRARVPVGQLVFKSKRGEYVHRWAPRYKRKFLYRLHLLEEWYKWREGKVCFLTVTTRQDLSIEDQIVLLKSGFQKLKKEYARQCGALSYLSAMDFHKTGYAHIHVVIFSPVSYYVQAIFSEKWAKWGYGSAEYGLSWKNKENGEVAKIVNYLFKHTAKVFSISAMGALRFHSTIFAMYHSQNHEYPGVRLFSMSKDIGAIMKIPDSGHECMSFQYEGKTLYIDEDIGLPRVRDEITKMQNYFDKLTFS